MTTIDIDAMYKTRYFEVAELLDETLGTEEEDRSGDGIVQDVHLLAQQRNEARAELEKIREQLTAANRHADGLEADLRSANTANTAYANENARLRSQLDSFEALLNQTQDRLVEAREQLFAQKPVIEAAEAWAEMRETDDVTPTEARKLAGALHDAIEQHRLMDAALASARTEQPAEATR